MSDALSLQQEVERFVKEHNILKKDFATKTAFLPSNFRTG